MKIPKKIIKTLKVIFLLSASITLLFSVWCAAYYLIAYPEITSECLSSIKILQTSLILTLANAITGSIFLMWETCFYDNTYYYR